MHEGAKLWLGEEGDVQQSRWEPKTPGNHGCTTTINSWAGIQHLSVPQVLVPESCTKLSQGTGWAQMQWVSIPALLLPHSPLLGPQPAGTGDSDRGLKDWHQLVTQIIQIHTLKEVKALQSVLLSKKEDHTSILRHFFHT